MRRWNSTLCDHFPDQRWKLDANFQKRSSAITPLKSIFCNPIVRMRLPHSCFKARARVQNYFQAVAYAVGSKKNIYKKTALECSHIKAKWKLFQPFISLIQRSNSKAVGRFQCKFLARIQRDHAVEALFRWTVILITGVDVFISTVYIQNRFRITF